MYDATIGVIFQGSAMESKQAILRVMKKDTEVGKRRDALSQNASSFQRVSCIQSYCDEVRSLDMSDCPASFRVAYRHHISAWQDMAEALRQFPDTGPIEDFFLGFFYGLFYGERDAGRSRELNRQNELKKVSDRVRATWDEVERIAAQYDVG